MFEIRIPLSEEEMKLIRAVANSRGLDPDSYAKCVLLEDAQRELDGINNATPKSNQWDDLMYMMETPTRETQLSQQVFKNEYWHAGA